MAFPQVVGTPTPSSHGGAVTNHVVSLPTFAAGELAIVLVAINGGSNATTYPAGWTKVLGATANNIGGAWGYRICDGTEGSSITVTTPSAAPSAHLVYRIQGHGSTAQIPQAGTNVAAVTAAPDPPSRTPTGGAKNYLWLAYVMADSGYVVTAPSADYTDLVTADSGAGANLAAAISSFRRELNAASENPGTATLEGSEGTLANLIVIHPGTEGSVTEVSTARDVRWSVLQAISATRDARWSVLAAVGTARDLRWSVLEQVIKTADLRWSLLAIAGELQTRVVTTPERTASFPLGVFLLPSPLEEVTTGGQKMVTYEAYDQSHILLDDKVTARYVVAAAANVITEVRALLNSAGIVKQNLTASALTLASTLTWEPGTPKLTIINALLRLINYVSLYFDSSGYATCRPYVVPTDAPVAYAYRDDAISVIHDEAQRTLDLFSVPNTWTVMVSDADRELISTYVNDNPDSPTSTVTRGHVVVSFRSAQPEDAVDQTTLDALAERIAFEESQVYETVRFSSAIMPIHEEAEVLWLEHAALGADGKYQETGWDFELVAGARMNHQARRVVAT